MIVVDASAVVRLLVSAQSNQEIANLAFASGQILHAPHLMDAEVAHVLRRYAAAGKLDEARGLISIEALRGLRIIRHPHGGQLYRVWALRHNFTAYDALYVALAQSLGASLLTMDERLRAAIRQYTSLELL